jgi:hypothetical protein
VNWFKYRNYWLVAAMILVLPIMAWGQTSIGSITLRANVSDTVALSVSPNFLQDNVQVAGHSDLKSLTLTLSGSTNEMVSVRVPILIRSNTRYKISGVVQPQAATLTNFVVLDARPTGRFVAPDSFANLNVVRDLDSRNQNGMVQVSSLRLPDSSPLTILSGSRVSLAGTLNSVDNALEVMFLIVVKPDAGVDGWSVRLTLLGSAGDHF